MGLFSFIKHAGPKMFGVDKTNIEENVEELKSEQATAKKLEERIRDLKLPIQNLKIKIEDDMATVLGKAQDDSTKEKVVLIIGNTCGIASVDDQMTVDHTEHQAHFYTVIKGDTLETIANKYYGNPMSYPIIFDANKPMLAEPDKIFPGQVLRIPRFE